MDVRGKRIVLKPNLVEFEHESKTVNTNPILVYAGVQAFRELARPVSIAEGPGHRRDTLDLADAAGYFGTVSKFEDCFTDLNSTM